jgi:hypothetical protein
VLDELPSLELAASAVALVLVLRVLVLLRRGAGLSRGQARAESGRARDLIGLTVLAGALLYAVRVHHASTWLVVASGIAIVAQLVGFYLRSTARKSPARPADEDDEPTTCPECGHGELIELVDTGKWLGGLSQATDVSALVCPNCGALSGQLEDPSRVPVGTEHGTALRRSAASGEQEALEEPTDHDG